MASGLVDQILTYQRGEDAKGNTLQQTSSQQHGKVARKSADCNQGNDQDVVAHECFAIAKAIDEKAPEWLEGVRHVWEPHFD